VRITNQMVWLSRFAMCINACGKLAYPIREMTPTFEIIRALLVFDCSDRHGSVCVIQYEAVFALAGHSMGGRVALENNIVLHQQRITRLAL